MKKSSEKIKKISKTRTKSRIALEKLLTPNNLFITAIFLTVSVLFWFLRLANFENNMNFILDQPSHMIAAKEMVDTRKIPLIGPMDGTRVVNGKSYFIGPQYYYVLGILGLALKWDVVSITKFILFYWWITGLIMFFWIAKKLDLWSALFAYTIFSLTHYMIVFNKMIINPNFLPLISIPLLYFFWKAISKNKLIFWLTAGFFAGLIFSFHFSGILWFLLIVLIWIVKLVKKETKLISIILFAMGAALGNFPYVIFELRHNFYNLKTFLENGANPHNLTFATPFYYYGFMSIYLWAIAVIYFQVGKKICYQNKVIILLVSLLLVVKGNFPIPNHAFGMPSGWTVGKEKFVAAKICEDTNKKNFEVANLISGDYRAEELRWWTQLCGSKSLPYDGYPIADTLFLIDRGETARDIHLPAWEVATMYPRKVEYAINLDDNVWFYKLTRTRENITN